MWIGEYGTEFVEVESYLLALDTAQQTANMSHIYALLSLLVDFCLRSFRKDVFETIQSILLPASREAALAGSIPLCGPALQDQIDPAYLPLHIAQSRLCQTPCEVSDIVNWFWMPQLEFETNAVSPLNVTWSRNWFKSTQHETSASRAPPVSPGTEHTGCS